MEKFPKRPLRVAKKERGKKYSKAYRQFLWKDSERQCADFAHEVDDPDSLYGQLESKRGRVGHITFLGVDVITNNWAWENKKVENYNKEHIEWMLHVLEKSDEMDKFPVLRLDIQIPIRDNTLGIKRLPPMYVIPEEVFRYLLKGQLLDREENEESS